LSAWYNERDPLAAQWLRNLIEARLIAPGIVDERDIRDVEPAELAGYTQCHFFAGIGVWSRALRQSGWPDDRQVWTGSCPCQPFSAAGKREGFADERHLWPHWYWLIEQCAPSSVLGEQVASKDGLGWLDLVSTDLEAAGYAFAPFDLCAAGFAGAHIRQRIYFVGLADCDDARLEGWHRVPERADQRPAWQSGVAGGMVNADGGNASATRLQRSGQYGQQPEDGLPLWRTDCRLGNNAPGTLGTGAPLLGRNAADWLFCRDGRWRPVEPGTFPLADAAPARVGRLRAYGNALDAETAAQFCLVVSEALAINEQREAA